MRAGTHRRRRSGEIRNELRQVPRKDSRRSGCDRIDHVIRACRCVCRLGSRAGIRSDQRAEGNRTGAAARADGRRGGSLSPRRPPRPQLREERDRARPADELLPGRAPGPRSRRDHRRLFERGDHSVHRRRKGRQELRARRRDPARPLAYEPRSGHQRRPSERRDDRRKPSSHRQHTARNHRRPLRAGWSDRPALRKGRPGVRPGLERLRTGRGGGAAGGQTVGPEVPAKKTANSS